MAETRALEVVEDYPHNVIDFDRRFDSEEACIAYLVSLRWPQGFVCPECSGRKAWRRTRLAMLCASCRHETSIIAGTLFEKTHKPLQVWFKAMWWVTSQKTGASALGLQRILGLGSYETAWLWLHKLRPAMVRSGRDRLTGCVEVDETYIGGPEEGVQGRETHEKSIVAIAVEVHSPKGFGRVRMHRVGDCSEGNLTPFVQGAVEPGAVVMTDGWKGYSSSRLTKFGYIHHPKNISASGNPAHVVMPGVHRVAALLKRWLLGTHQGSVSAQHLDYYLDEFVFRFNRRTSTHRGQLFFRLLQQAVAIEPTTYADIVGRRDPTDR
jgi:transposase-like protein